MQTKSMAFPEKKKYHYDCELIFKKIRRVQNECFVYLCGRYLTFGSHF